MSKRVSDERLSDMIAEIKHEDNLAAATGQAHGNYGEDFGAVVFDLRDARAALAKSEGERDATEKLVGWARSIMELCKGGAEDVIMLRTDGASFASLFHLVAALDALDKEGENI